MNLMHWPFLSSRTTCTLARIAAGSALVGVLAIPVAHAQSRYPITPEQQRIADQTASAGVPLSELADNAPDKHVVVRGDTLWDISSKFLKRPWRWPELWGMNKEEIKNPHLIYPGQILLLERDGDRARLRLASPAGGSFPDTPCMQKIPGDKDGTIKVKPCTRSESLANDAIPAIPYNVIAPFLSQPLIVTDGTLKSAPRIAATQEGRLKLGPNDIAYVRGITDPSVTDYFVFRPATPLRDPGSRQILAYEAFFLGSARLTRPGDPATVRILSAKEEIGVSDRLVPSEKAAFVNYVPRAPQTEAKGRVVSIYGGVNMAGNNQIITLNLGKNHGVEIGDVFSLAHFGGNAKDRSDGRNQNIRLPDEPYGLIFVFRTFDQLSYALVMNVRMPVEIGDLVQKP